MTQLPMLAKLPATRSTKGKPRGLEYRPWSKLAIVDEPRRVRKYIVNEQPTQIPGRAFRFDKQGEPACTPRCCLVADDGNHICDCEGFESDAMRKADGRDGARFSDAQPCIHIQVAVVLVVQGWLDRLDRADAHRSDDSTGEDTGATECPEVDEMPECFRLPTLTALPAYTTCPF